MYKFSKTMMKRFYGRVDTYGLQRHKDGKMIYFRIEGKEITQDVYYQHLMGEEVLAVYPLRVDGTTSFACLDLDTADLGIVAQVRQLLPEPNYLECSRSGNYHVWMFFDQPVDAEIVLSKTQAAVSLGDSLIEDDHCGIYPIPQPRGKVGLLIALPLQGKGVDNDRSVFVDADGAPFADQQDYMTKMKLLTHHQLKKFDAVQNADKEVTEILKDPAVYDLYIGRNKKGGDRTSSGYDFAFATILADRGVTREASLTLLSMRPTVHSTNTSYITKTIEAGFKFSQKKKDTKKKRVKGKVRESEGNNGDGQDEAQEVLEESWKDIIPLERGDFLKGVKELIIFEEEQQRLFDVFLATIIANLRTTGRPVWLFLIGPPGCGKTLPMMTVQNSPFTYVVSAFRPAALISGWGMTSGQDMSLIPKLNNKILLVKDMSSLLSQNKEMVAEILGLLRDAYDGSCAKAFGTGVTREYKSRFGFIGATTPEIDANWSMNVRLGERFLRYRVKTPRAQVYQKIDCALENLTVEDDNELKLEEVCLGYLKHLMRESGTMPRLGMRKEIGRLAQLGAILRSGVARAPFNNQVLVVPEWEEATRFAKQLAKMAIALAYLRDKEVNDYEEFEDLKAFVRDGIDGRIERVCRLLYARPGLDTTEMARRLYLPDWTVRQIVQDLEILRIILRSSTSGMSPKYDFVPWIRGSLDTFRLWSENEDDLEKEIEYGSETGSTVG